MIGPMSSNDIMRGSDDWHLFFQVRVIIQTRECCMESTPQIFGNLREYYIKRQGYNISIQLEQDHKQKIDSQIVDYEEDHIPAYIFQILSPR